MRAHVFSDDADLLHVELDHLRVHATGAEATIRARSPAFADRPEEGAVLVLGMSGQFQVACNQRCRVRVNRQEALLAPFAVDQHVQDAPPLLPKVFHLQSSQFFAAQSMEQEHAQDGPIPHALERVGWWRIQQCPGLDVTERRSFSFLALDLGTFYAFDRVMGHGVGVAQVFIQGRQRGEFAPDAGAGQLLVFQIVSPGQDVAARDQSKVLGSRDAGTLHE